jgi:hypothetical protein
MIPEYPVGTVFECRELGFNNWHETDDAGNEIALQFETVDEARDTFRSFVANVRDAIQSGSTEPGCDVDPDAFDLIAILPDKTEIFIETGETIMEKSPTDK